MENKYIETEAYKCYKRYKDSFYLKSNLDAVLKENRDFVAGNHYSSYHGDLPKPTFNICREYIEKVSAKLLETKYSISFIADMDTENLTTLDNFYDCQMKEIDDEEYIAQATRMGLIDGVGVMITSFDEDTLGIPTLFRGFLKRQVIPFEQTFWENPYCEDEQDQQYWGYYLNMQISAVKKMVEGLSEQEINELIVPENYLSMSSVYQDRTSEDIDSEQVRVYVRFFRIDGEVFFEMTTRWCNLFEYPHALNPKINNKVIKLKKNELDKKIQNDEVSTDKKINDYNFDDAKYTLFSKAIAFNDKDYKKSKSKFYRYPVSIYRPYPIVGSILGESGVSMIVANQKIVNYIFLIIILIMQSHAMPKILTKPEALKGQEYDNSPNQILTDYTPISSGVAWGITRLSSGDAINSNLIDIGSNIINLTKNINGFADLISNISSETSGYAYQQVVQQANLTLELPQKRLWRCIKNNARTDLLYFKHYVPKAKYYVKLSDSEYELNENYRNLSQKLVDTGNTDLPPGTTLPRTRTVQVKEVNSTMFDSDFNVIIDIEQGIASSVLTESQHYNQVFQYIAAGNLDADKIKLLIQNDPAFSAKTRQRITNSLEVLETSQLQLKNQEINELQTMIQTLVENLKISQQNLEILKLRDKSRNKAFDESIKENKAFFEAYASQNQPLMSESEVKALNAKGISGTSFSSQK